MDALRLALASALGGAGLGLAASAGAGDPVSWSLGGALLGVLLARLELACHPGETRRLALAWLPGILPLILPMVARLPMPSSVLATFPAAAASHELVSRYAAGILLLLTLALGIWARAWIFFSGKICPESPLRDLRLVLVGSALSAFVFALMACLACLAFHKSIDLAGENEVVYHLSLGQGPLLLLHESFPQYQHPVYWSVHFTLMWALVAPLYRLWDAPYVLLILQAIAVSAAAVPLYAALAPRLGSRQAAGLALAYLLYPTTQHAMLHEVHGLSWAVPFTAGLWWAIRFRKWGWAIGFALLALCCREEVFLVLAGLGLAFLCERGRRLWGVALVAASALGFVLLVNHLMPSLGQSGDWRNYKFPSLGHTNGEILRTLLTRPLYVAGLFLDPAKLMNSAIFLLPLAALPLLGGRVSLVAAPLFLALFLSDNVAAYCYLLFYTLPVVPFLFLGTGEALLRLERWGGTRLRDSAWVAVLGACLASAVIFGPSPIGRTFWQKGYPLGVYAEPYHYRGVYAQTDHVRLGHALLDRIPSEAVISAQAVFLPHLARVRRMKLLPVVHGADYVLLDTKHPNRYELREPGRYEVFVEGLRRDPAWRLRIDEDGYLLFERKGAPPLRP